MRSEAACGDLQGLVDVPVACENDVMSMDPKPISIADAISPLPVEGEQDVQAWHLKKIRDRHKAADEGRFASDADVRAVIRKFIPDK